MNSRLQDALDQLYDGTRRGWNETPEFIKEYDLNIENINRHCGSLTITPICLLPHRHFDFADHGAESVWGCVIEALDRDGETIDLVAWPINNPRDVRTLCGAASIVGLAQALNASSFIFGRPLRIHQTVLGWLQSDCRGAAIVTPALASRLLVDIPGPLAAADTGHADGLRKMMTAPARRIKILIPERGMA